MDELAARTARALEPIAGVRLAHLFGSRVTGRMRPDRDLDLASSTILLSTWRTLEQTRRDILA